MNSSSLTRLRLLSPLAFPVSNRIISRSFPFAPLSRSFSSGHHDDHSHDSKSAFVPPPPRPLAPKGWGNALISMLNMEDTAYRKSFFASYWQKSAVIISLTITAMLFWTPPQSGAEKYAIYKLYVIDGYRPPNLSPVVFNEAGELQSGFEEDQPTQQ